MMADNLWLNIWKYPVARGRGRSVEATVCESEADAIEDIADTLEEDSWRTYVTTAMVGPDGTVTGASLEAAARERVKEGEEWRKHLQIEGRMHRFRQGGV